MSSNLCISQLADASIVAVQPGDNEREEREDLHPGAGAAPVPQARQRQRILLDGVGGGRPEVPGQILQ